MGREGGWQRHHSRLPLAGGHHSPMRHLHALLARSLLPADVDRERETRTTDKRSGPGYREGKLLGPDGLVFF